MAEARQGEAAFADRLENPGAVRVGRVVGALEITRWQGSAKLHHHHNRGQQASESSPRALPLILTRDAEAAWLDPKTQEPEKLLSLLRQYPPEEMEFYAVSRDVNSPAADKASNIEPIDEKVCGQVQPSV